MKTIKFDCNGNSAPAYGCNKPVDNSGEYVPAAVAQRLYNALDAIVDRADSEGVNLPDYSEVLDALAAADGEDV